MIPVQPPITQYTDAAGKPLEGGAIYIGQAGQDPASNPQTAYWDVAGTIPAAQPLRTVGGYIVNNGAPAEVYVAGNHSIAVKDRNGVQVFLDLNRQANPQGFLTAVTGPQVHAALGFVPARSFTPTITEGANILSDTTDFNNTRQGALTVETNNGTSALVQYSRPAIYGIKAGLDGNNSFCIGGWSQGHYVQRVYWDVSGNQVTMGNVTAYSDARFKEEVTPIADSVARTLQMRGVRYLDNRDGQYKVGAIAQEAQQAGFSEAVLTDENGHLSLAYGQLALPLVIENTRALLAMIGDLQHQINELKG